MKSLLNSIQKKLCHQQVNEKLVITKDTKEKNSELSFIEFIDMIKDRSIEIHGKPRSLPKSYLKANFNNFNKDAENFKYKLLDNEFKNHWKYKMCFEYCNKLLKNQEIYRTLSDIEVIAISYPIEIFGHTNYSLDNSDDEYYIFYINLKDKTFEIYEVIN